MTNLRSCTVSFRDASGIQHSLEITAESLYEAAALAIKVFRSKKWDVPLPPPTALQIAVKAPAVTHTLTIKQVEDWVGATPKNPKEALTKKRLRELLADKTASGSSY